MFERRTRNVSTSKDSEKLMSENESLKLTIEESVASCEVLEKKNFQEIYDRISGCIFAGALGDALGYAVEFDSYKMIQMKYGKDGIRKPKLTGSKANISDDTQMTLFTMEGMSSEYAREEIQEDGKNVVDNIYLSYLKWLQTQRPDWNSHLLSNWTSKLAEIPEMNSLRAPGNTCLSALASEQMGTIENPINNSKGCGGVMRTAPLGFTKIYGSALLNGAKAAAITHGHPLGWIPAGMLSDIVFKSIYGEKKPLKAIIEDSLEDTKAQFKDYEDIVYFEKLIKKAIALSETAGDDVTIIEKELGGGWVGEEALAIAVYCCLKYSDDMKKMLTTAVNHSGDSDSTGAVAGNILGAYAGMHAVPDDWLDCLELVPVIQKQIDNMMVLVGYCSHGTIPRGVLP